MKHPYLFKYKLSYRNEFGTNHHGLLPTSFDALKFFLEVRLHEGSLPNFNFSTKLQSSPLNIPGNKLSQHF